MSHDLITIVELEARTGKTYAGAELAKAEALIVDASALVVQIAETEFHDDVDALDLPGAVRPVVVAMVRRALEVPAGAAAGLTGEQVGSYGWQSNSSGASQPAASIYATRREIWIIRTAAGVSPMKSISVGSEFEPYLEDADGVIIS